MNTPIFDLKRDYDLKETVSREVVKIDGEKYLCIVFRIDDGFSYYWHDYSQPYAFHGIVSGFGTEAEAKEEMMSILRGE